MEGGCECGRIRYRLEGAPIFAHCCHCRQCQKITGAPFAFNAMVERAHLAVIAGEVDASSGRGRCRDCGVLLWGTHRMFGEAILFLRVGTLDEGDRIVPDAHFFVRSKHPWIELPAGVRGFETLPGEGDAPLFGEGAAARVEAARQG